ncbi:cupin domain-containing protein [Roseococcus sp. SDR]|uniref:cupin domain-containing protein n=1 Tax=Roseococcus sp. SDR TaxID=2835532 RepID=UPI001BD0C360|nr:cupin domain-containing protein [Roseococcus sp. SDR]MBS7791676.1 cupin domain-containing protein [Roseococcus sp. SDR]MBV1846990.1 cupin domain-containing protein [Roseococcus sp. SDR]
MTDMASLPVQRPKAPATPAAARARFFNSGNAFNVKLPPVPAAEFGGIAAAALAPGAPTGIHLCDQSAAIGCPFPATSPLMLARYAVIRAGETLALDTEATGLIGHVLRGAGQCDGFAWGAGDVLLLPGGAVALHAREDAVLWLVGNDPLLAFENLRAGPARMAPVHFPAAEIDRQLDLIGACTSNDNTAGLALIFSSDGLEAWRNLTASMTLSLNTLPPRQSQRAHRHNAAAITLVLQGEDCHSRIAGETRPWSLHNTLVTPPGEPHSHHNGGDVQARFLIVQDGGLHYHARTMGFTFLE